MEHRAEEEIARAVADATHILNDFVNPPDLPNLRGLLILMCQYLRLGKYAYYNGSWHLDKNLTALLSRTDLSVIRQGLPLGERTWLGNNRGALKTKIKNRTGRQGTSELMTDTQQTQTTGTVEVDTFIDNVFTQGADGFTSTLGGFRQMGAEQIHPRGSRLSDTSKLGPVFELRNMVPFLATQERFPRTSWAPLASYLTTVLRSLHERTDAQAMRDAKIKARGPDDDNAGKYEDVEVEGTWKT